MDYRNELSLAWALFDAIRPELTVNDVTKFSVLLSTADAVSTIGQLLEHCVQTGLDLPAQTVDRVYRWLECYAGHTAEDQLGLLVTQLTIRPTIAPPSFHASSGANWVA